LTNPGISAPTPGTGPAVRESSPKPRKGSSSHDSPRSVIILRLLYFKRLKLIRDRSRWRINRHGHPCRQHSSHIKMSSSLNLNIFSNTIVDISRALLQKRIAIARTLSSGNDETETTRERERERERERRNNCVNNYEQYK